MLVPNRNYSSPEYRYGFQGQEKDDEIKGPGNSINYKFRMHDPRVGKFFAVDPLTAKFPWYTPYQFAGNSPILYIDLEGQEPTKPELFWKKIDKNIIKKKYGKDFKYMTMYITEGLHNSHGRFTDELSPSKMYVVKTYSEAETHYYYYNNIKKKLISFDPSDIGGNAEEISEFVSKTILFTGLVVSGIEFPVFGRQLINQVKSQVVLNSAAEAISLITSEEDFNLTNSLGNIFSASVASVDVADGVTSIVFKGSGPKFAMFKNLLLSAIDVNLVGEYNENKNGSEIGVDFAASMFLDATGNEHLAKSKFHKALKKIYDEAKEIFVNETSNSVKEKSK